MTAIAIVYLTGANVVDGVEHGDEHRFNALFTQQVVRLRQTHTGIVTLQGNGADERTADGHEDGGGNTFSRYVGHYQSDVVVVNAEEVVEVASDILCRGHHSRQVELVLVLGEWREDTWQDGLLDFSCYCEVGLQRLQLRVFLLRLFDILYLLDGLLDGQTEVVEVDGLCCKVEGSVIHGRTDVVHVAISRYHDALQGGVLQFVYLCEQCQTVHFRHVDITQNDVDILLTQQKGEGLQTVVGKEKLVFSLTYFATEILCQQQLKVLLVVDA